MNDMAALVDIALYRGRPIEAAPVACSDPECGWVSGYVLDPETDSWADVPERVTCGFNWGNTDCEAPARVFKSEVAHYRPSCKAVH